MALALTWRWFFAVVLVGSLANCGAGPCGCPFGTVCLPDYSKPETFRCEPAPRNSDETATLPHDAV